MLKNILHQSLLIALIFNLPITVTYAQNYEITPFAGWRSSSSVEEEATGESVNLDETNSFGLMLSMKQYQDSNYDFLFSRQDTEIQSTTSQNVNTRINFDYYHIGGTVFYKQKLLHPFLSGGLGITHISPSNSIFSTETRPSVSIGGGVKLPLMENVGLRLEARGYGTVVDSASSILCSGGGCLIRFKGELYTQFEAIAGVSIAF